MVTNTYDIPLTQAFGTAQPLKSAVVYIRKANKLRYCAGGEKTKLKFV